ncbi:MAG: helix-turn-helix transcriptional regulator [Prevotellaceae bacterium]|nr:helix-turn-helix transcriptional regulator [Prevotellaceae bacterium]
MQPFADSLKRLHELSPYYFSSIIREKSGKSALQWIGNITMIFSRQYLKCSDMSIKEIADCLNFPDQSYFTRYFKHHEGCSPMEFRNRRLQD